MGQDYKSHVSERWLTLFKLHIAVSMRHYISKSQRKVSLSRPCINGYISIL